MRSSWANRSPSRSAGPNRGCQSDAKAGTSPHHQGNSISGWVESRLANQFTFRLKRRIYPVISGAAFHMFASKRARKLRNSQLVEHLVPFCGISKSAQHLGHRTSAQFPPGRSSSAGGIGYWHFGHSTKSPAWIALMSSLLRRGIRFPAYQTTSSNG